MLILRGKYKYSEMLDEAVAVLFSSLVATPRVAVECQVR